MGLLDAWSSRVHVRRDEQVEFVGELTGPPQDTLKRALILEFATRPDIRRAYFTRLGGEAQSATSMVLCILSARPGDQSVIRRVGEIFSRVAPQGTELEILFVSAEQEADLARVSSPFYRSAI
jgi:hypothetical protein